MKAQISDGDFINLFEELGASGLTKKLGCTLRATYARRERIEKRTGQQIATPNQHKSVTRFRNVPTPPGFVQVDIADGVILVGADAHIWPGPPSTAMRAFVKFCKELKPAVVIMNGDVMDFPSISRHPPIGWEKVPEVQDELEAAQEQLGQIEKAAFKARKIWSIGNHDQRFPTRLAIQAPQFARVHGTSLKHHFPLWEPCWAISINQDIIVKHRFKGGIHATHNNVLWSGRTMITGHLHSAKVTGLTDYNGDRWGVDTGCLADPEGRQFVDYTEAGPKNWRSGFCVLSFVGGRLLQPELVLRWDADHVQFRGKVIKV